MRVTVYNTVCLLVQAKAIPGQTNSSSDTSIELYPHILDPLAVDTDRLRSLFIKRERIFRNALPPAFKSPLQRMKRSLIGFAQ